MNGNSTADAPSGAALTIAMLAKNEERNSVEKHSKNGFFGPRTTPGMPPCLLIKHIYQFNEIENIIRKKNIITPLTQSPLPTGWGDGHRGAGKWVSKVEDHAPECSAGMGDTSAEITMYR